MVSVGLSAIPLEDSYLNLVTVVAPEKKRCQLDLRLYFFSDRMVTIIIIIIIIVVVMETEAGLRGLCIPEIDVKSLILITKYYSKLRLLMPWTSAL